jgi:hypothetical protein
VSVRAAGRLALLAIALLGAWYWGGSPSPQAFSPSRDEPSRDGFVATQQPAIPERDGEDEALRRAVAAQARGLPLQVSGVVERILADDRNGSPHQRFIIRTSSAITLLIAHNLDLAPRLEGLAPGEAVRVVGDYEWNERGGVMHWTHDDPAGYHRAGYVEWRGRRYQ